MNHLLKISGALAMIVAIGSMGSSCTRDFPSVATQDSLANFGTVQVFSATLKAARNNIFVDNVRISTAALGYQAVYPGTAYSFKVAAGSRSFLIKDTLATSTQVPLTFTQNVEAGKNYTIFTYDTITTIKQVTVTNAVTVPTDTTSRLRFANFVYSPSAPLSVDVYRKNATTPLFTNVTPAKVTDFVSYPSGVTDSLFVYATGTTSPLIGKYFITSLTPTRSYTAVYNGSNVTNGTAKALSTFANY